MADYKKVRHRQRPRPVGESAIRIVAAESKGGLIVWMVGWMAEGPMAAPSHRPEYMTTTNPLLHCTTTTERVKPDGNFWGRFIKPTALSFPGAVYAVDFSPVGG